VRIGIDFDNTIVCYDEVFCRAAVEKGLLEPAAKARGKQLVRDTLRDRGMEDDWTELQGYVYGAAMPYATPYPGLIAFLNQCRSANVPVCIISHKTRHPFHGPSYDLHQAAWDWLVQQGFFEADGIGLARDAVYFELTKPEKIARIGALGCTHFIDDLPELLREPGWSADIKRILFDPDNTHTAESEFPRLRSWADASTTLLASGST
jgi:hypothetical protein